MWLAACLLVCLSAIYPGLLVGETLLGVFLGGWQPSFNWFPRGHTRPPPGRYTPTASRSAGSPAHPAGLSHFSTQPATVYIKEDITEFWA